MSRAAALALVVAVAVVPCARAGQPPGADTSRSTQGSVRLPISAADLAAAVGLRRVDPSTLPLDIVRLAFAAPDGFNPDESAARAALARALERTSSGGDLIPLPLSPRAWREHVLRDNVPDERLAAAIFSRRSSALLYHGLLGVHPDTLEWLERSPATIAVLHRYSALAAVCARSIRIRDGSVETPGDNARDVWTALTGADPARPAEFIAALFSSRSGRVARFFDMVAHLDPPHQAFVLGRPGDPGRVKRARRLLDIEGRQSAEWRIEDRPFLRPDVDAALLLRVVDVDGEGRPRAPASAALWAQVFGEGGGGGGLVDAVWLAGAILDTSGGTARRRLDTFRFAQRALGGSERDAPTLIFVLRQFSRFPALMLTLEARGVTSAAEYATAARVAAGLDGDREDMAVFQSSLAIIDRAATAGTIGPAEAQALIASLLEAGSSGRGRGALVTWISTDLLAVLRREMATPGDGEAVVLAAMAGRAAAQPPTVQWEGQEYVADLAPADLRRLTQIRRSQREMTLDAALAEATPRNMTALAHSLTALAYAAALGDPDSATATSGPVWRRHRFGGSGSGEGEMASAWRVATEVFFGGWHVTGSLLHLELAFAQSALRRLDATEMPAASVLSSNDRRTLASTIALIEPRRATDAERDAIATAIARGRARAAALAEQPATFDQVASDAVLSEWRRNAVGWLLAHDSAAVPRAFTILEQFRLGGGVASSAWGAAAVPIDGCLCLRLPDRVPWEEFMGRASTGQLGTQLPDVVLRVAEALSARKLPAFLVRDVAAFAMQDVLDHADPAYFDDWLPVAFAARDLPEDRLDDYIAALTAAAGPLMPRRTVQ